MAQAPDKEEGAAPRKTTTYNKFEGMESQNERYNVKQNEMFWIENIMRTGPRKLSSVPGPGFRRYFPDTLPTLCTDNSERGQQHIDVVTAFQQTGEVPGGSTNDRTSWAYVNPTGDVVTLNGDAACGGGNMSYTDTCCQLNRFLDNVPIVNDHPALVPPLGGNAVNARIGIADEQAYAANDNSFGTGGHGALRVWFPDAGDSTTFRQPPGYSGYQVVTWCKKGSEAWLFVNQTAFTPHRMLNRFSIVRSALAPPSTFDFDSSALSGDYVSQISLTSSKLVALAFNVSNTANCAIKMIDRSNGALAQTIDLSNLRPSFAFGVNDNLIYILCGASFPAFPAKLYYWNGADIIYVGIAHNYPNQPFSFGAGQFSGGRYYFGRNGFGGFPVDIYSLAVACAGDGGPVVASITAGAGTVAHGATIPVSWANVLEPDNYFPPFHDTISLYAAPAAGTLGYNEAASLADLATDGASSGTLTFTIPSSTPPGDYVFRYQAGQRSKAILVATSPSFTVT